MKYLTLISVLSLTLLGCNSPAPSSPTPEARAAALTPSPTSSPVSASPGLVTVTAQQRESMGLRLLTIGTQSQAASVQRTGKIEVDPDRRIVVSPHVAGTVAHLPIIVGSRVRAGDVIAVLDSPEITAVKSDYRAAQVEVELAAKELANTRQLVAASDEIRRGEEEASLELSQAEAQKATATARLESSRLTYQRLSKLQAEGIASAQQVEQARAELKVLEAELQEAEHMLTVARKHLFREESVSRQELRKKAETLPAEAALARAEEKLKHLREQLVQLGADPNQNEGALTLTSPIDGQVLERPVARGQRVNAGDPVAAVVDPREVWAWIDLRRSDLAFVEIGSEVSVALAADSASVAKGAISHIDAQMAPDSQTIRARVTLRETSGAFRAGSFVTATLHNEASALPALPDQAVQEVEGETAVYLAEPSGFRRVPVTVVGSSSGQSVVSGLPAGSQVVVYGASDLKALELSAGSGGGE